MLLPPVRPAVTRVSARLAGLSQGAGAGPGELLPLVVAVLRMLLRLLAAGLLFVQPLLVLSLLLPPHPFHRCWSARVSAQSKSKAS